ncbi:VOC family protein [Amycolatopsis sp. NPDC059021]|uniref:VOC family protein n=1 Tax=Amycolatopsis sp. NPDC059021 TaxID=3346704 RepID=UPI00366E3B1C
MNISHVQFLTVPVADHAKARDFYVDTLGFELLLDHRGPHGQFVMVAPKGAQTGLVLVDYQVAGLDLTGPLHIQLHTGDVDADVAELREAGIEAEDPQKMPWGRATSFKDLDGNAISLLEPSEYGNRPR